MSYLTEFRREKDQYFGQDPGSPLTIEQRRGFQGLDYFDENPGLRFKLKPEPTKSDDIVPLQTSTGDLARFTRWGKLSFSVDGIPIKLTVFQDTDNGSLFLPFTDATTGGETYGEGRYLEVEVLGDDACLIDFNYAYNPYCAYNDGWSCPLTPQENRLAVPIRAGEKVFDQALHCLAYSM